MRLRVEWWDCILGPSSSLGGYCTSWQVNWWWLSSPKGRENGEAADSALIRGGCKWKGHLNFCYSWWLDGHEITNFTLLWGFHFSVEVKQNVLIVSLMLLIDVGHLNEPCSIYYWSTTSLTFGDSIISFEGFGSAYSFKWNYLEGMNGNAFACILMTKWNASLSV